MTTRSAVKLVDSVSYGAKVVNEDRGTAMTSAAWIMDGATSIGPQRLVPGQSDALWLVELCDAWLRVHTETGQMEVTELNDLAAFIRKQFLRDALVGEFDPSCMPSLSLAVLQVNNGYLNLLNLGDCKILLQTRKARVIGFGSSNVRNFDLAVVRYLDSLMREGHNYASAWELAKERILENRSKMNCSGGYAVIDLTDRWVSAVQIEKMQMSLVECALLMTDGFYRLVDTYFAYDDLSVLTASRTSGLKTLYHQLREIETGDPQGLRYPRIKLSDDATALLVEFDQ